MTSVQLLVQKLARRLNNSHHMFCFPSLSFTLFLCWNFGLNVCLGRWK